jgi:hypothetical protein
MASNIAVANRQEEKNMLSLFLQGTEFSNALNFLQVIPRWDRRKCNYIVSSNPEDQIRVYDTKYNDAQYQIRVTGAPIQRFDKKKGSKQWVNMWPGDREEKVESAILKIAASGGISNIVDDNYKGYGCYFSIFKIRELTGMNALDIKEAIEIMNKSTLEIEDVSPNRKRQDLLSATFLPVRYVSKTTGSTNDKCYVIFHPAVMKAIDSLQYRPYLYKDADMHKKGLTKYIHKRLIVKYTYASESTSYNFSLRTLMNDFGRLPKSEIVDAKDIKNRARDVRVALIELRDAGVIKGDFTSKNIKGDDGRSVDVTYVVSATPEFVKKQIQAGGIMKKKVEESKQLDIFQDSDAIDADYAHVH